MERANGSARIDDDIKQLRAERYDEQTRGRGAGKGYDGVCPCRSVVRSSAYFYTSSRSAAHEPLAIGVVGSQLLIPLELGPGNIALVVVADQNFPASPVVLHAPDYSLTLVLDRHARGPTADGYRRGHTPGWSACDRPSDRPVIRR
jgi:hypothetical protein